VASQSTQHETTHDAIARGHEGTEVSMRGVVFALIATFIAGGVALLVSWWLMSGVERASIRQDPPRSPLAGQMQPPPAPFLQPSPPQGAEPLQPWQDMAAYLKHEEMQLTSYRVLNEPNGRVQIPIERAMLILAAPTTGPATRPSATRPNRDPSGGLQR
jgi:hypothetical protein